MEVSDIHKRLKQLLKERHMTKYRLALNMGVKPPTFYNMFRRKTMPKIDTIENICKALDITVSDFFLFTGDQKNVGYVADDEIILLEKYRTLTSAQKDRLIAYADGMIDKDGRK